MKVGADHHQPIHQLGAAHRDRQSDDSTVAPPDQVGSTADDVLEHADGLSSHVLVMERGRRVRRIAMTSTVERHEPLPLRQRVTERIQQQIAVGHPAMQQQQRLGATAALVDPGRMPIYLDALAHATPPLASIPPARLYGKAHSS